jgi:YCII-related domain
VLLALGGLTPPSTMSARVTFKSGRSKVTDGPFTETKEVVGGYWLIQAKSREEALECASRIPARDIDMVEVRRMFEITDFPADFRRGSSSSSSRPPRAAISRASSKKNPPRYVDFATPRTAST